MKDFKIQAYIIGYGIAFLIALLTSSCSKEQNNSIIGTWYQYAIEEKPSGYVENGTFKYKIDESTTTIFAPSGEFTHDYILSGNTFTWKTEVWTLSWTDNKHWNIKTTDQFNDSKTIYFKK
ncbi:MAG TPA: hypothetical protein VJN02_07920 [Gammaproteobacteria bacterium]|nr:hypothetical protein [Gammaproteobacteria bacterium]